MFKGFQDTGTNTATIKPRQLFEGFVSTTSDNFGKLGGLVTDGLVAQFDPSVNITLNSGAVSSWSDTTGTYTITQTTAVNQPLYITGDNLYRQFPYLQFDGINDSLAATLNLGIGLNSGYTIIIVAKFNGLPAARALVSFNAANAGGYAIYGSGTSIISRYYNPALTNSTNNNVLSTDSNMLGLSIDNSNSIFYGSSNSNQNITGSTMTPATTLLGAFEVGRLAGANFAACNILDILIYNKLLSNSEWLSNYYHFKGKYGII